MTPVFNFDGHHLFVSMSIGVRLGQGDASPESFLLHADTAMYYAKSRGKQRYEVFVPDGAKKIGLKLDDFRTGYSSQQRQMLIDCGCDYTQGRTRI